MVVLTRDDFVKFHPIIEKNAYIYPTWQKLSKYREDIPCFTTVTSSGGDEIKQIWVILVCFKYHKL